MSKPRKTREPKLGRPSVAVPVVTTSIGIHPTALSRLDVEAKRAHLSRSALIVSVLRANFPSVFAGL